MLRGVRLGDEWIWEDVHDEHASLSPFVLEQRVEAEGGMMMWTVETAAGHGIYMGSCFAFGKALTLVQDRCVPLTWTATPHQPGAATNE